MPLRIPQTQFLQPVPPRPVQTFITRRHFINNPPLPSPALCICLYPVTPSFFAIHFCITHQPPHHSRVRIHLGSGLFSLIVHARAPPFLAVFFRHGQARIPSQVWDRFLASEFASLAFPMCTTRGHTRHDTTLSTNLVSSLFFIHITFTTPTQPLPRPQPRTQRQPDGNTSMFLSLRNDASSVLLGFILYMERAYPAHSDTSEPPCRILLHVGLPAKADCKPDARVGGTIIPVIGPDKTRSRLGHIMFNIRKQTETRPSVPSTSPCRHKKRRAQAT